jgi:hypothetical protein
VHASNGVGQPGHQAASGEMMWVRLFWSDVPSCVNAAA